MSHSSSSWCIEYANLSIKAKTLQRDCVKIKDKLNLVLLGQPRKKQYKVNSYRERHGYENNCQKDILEQKLLRLHEHCANIKDTLITVLNGDKEKTGEMPRTKNKCKKSIEDYEHEYESLRGLCNEEIEQLESKRANIYQSLRKEMEDIDHIVFQEK